MNARFSRVYSGELAGIDARCVEVEVDLHVGLHSFSIIGLADKALSEARERVGAAIKNSGAKPPAQENRKIIVNLAPADVKKTGSQYDLAIAIGYLVATEQVGKFETKDKGVNRHLVEVFGHAFLNTTTLKQARGAAAFHGAF